MCYQDDIFSEQGPSGPNLVVQMVFSNLSIVARCEAGTSRAQITAAECRVWSDSLATVQTWSTLYPETLVVGWVESDAGVALPQSPDLPDDWRCARGRLRYGTIRM